MYVFHLTNRFSNFEIDAKWSEDVEQQALFSLQVQQTLAPFLEQLAMDVQQEFVTALQEYM